MWREARTLSLRAVATEWATGEKEAGFYGLWRICQEGAGCDERPQAREYVLSTRLPQKAYMIISINNVF